MHMQSNRHTDIQTLNKQTGRLTGTVPHRPGSCSQEFPGTSAGLSGATGADRRDA